LARKSEFFSSIQPFVNSFNGYNLSLFITGVLFFLVSFNVTAQQHDTLLLVNGKEVVVSEVQFDSVVVSYKRVKKNGRLKKEALIDREMVFSIKRASGEEVLYAPTAQEIGSGAFSEREMRFFIMGQQDARTFYKTHWWSIGGAVIGGGLGYLSYDQIYVAAIPFVYTVSAGIAPVEYRHNNLRSQYVWQQEAYQLGFFKAAKSKRVFTALKTSLAGTIVGVAAGYATN